MSHVLASYEAFPSNEGPYVSGPASVMLPWAGDSFKNANLGCLECSYASNVIDHFDVTSGVSINDRANDNFRGLTAWLDI